MESQCITAISKFSLDVYNEIVGNSDDTVFFSPMSVFAALAMTMAGAGGNTLRQMLSSLSLVALVDSPTSTADLHRHVGAILQSFSRQTNGTLTDLANKIYIDNEFAVKEIFVSLIKQSYASDAEKVDFQKNHEAARLAINKWVENKTQNKIKDLLSRDAISVLTRLVIVNAIYFKGSWKHQFDQKLTRSENFKLLDGSVSKTDMMSMERKFFYLEKEIYMAALLPFENSDLQFLVILPKNESGLRNVEKEVYLNGFPSINAFHMQKLNLKFPRLKIETTAEMDKILKKLGMTDMFDAHVANFENISPELFVSTVAHKAFIEVDEKGAEAAAATAVVMNLRSMPMPEPPAVRFHCCHPFMLAVVGPAGEPLFLGRFTRP